MTRLRVLLSRLSGLLHKGSLERNLDEELHFHLQLETDRNLRAGMTPAEVIVAATKTAAELVRLNQLGTVAVGKSADFMVLDANPLPTLPTEFPRNDATVELWFQLRQ